MYVINGGALILSRITIYFELMLKPFAKKGKCKPTQPPRSSVINGSSSDHIGPISRSLFNKLIYAQERFLRENIALSSYNALQYFKITSSFNL